MENNKHTLLEVDNLSVSFRMYEEGFEQGDLEVISNLSISVDKGEILAIAGSSGSGKSLLAHAILGLLPENSTTTGSIRYKGSPIGKSEQATLRGGAFALVPQSTTYLDPLIRVGKQVQGFGPFKSNAQEQRRIFQRFDLNEKTEEMFPFQLSGGMARRVLISTAVISDAELIIADEPTPGLHLDQALEALKVFRELADEGRGIILITHDIDLAYHFADKIAVFYAGTTLEVTPAKDFETGDRALRHPYSKALWRALPQNFFEPIPGFQPYAKHLPKGCLFAPRCPLRTKECEESIPDMRELRGGYVRCFHAT